MRNFPETKKTLEQYVDTNGSDIELFQHFRYHSVYLKTHKNNEAMYFGQIGTIHDTSQNVFDKFSENGYITGFYVDQCEVRTFVFTSPKLMKFHKWDHLPVSIGCDSNYDYNFDERGEAIKPFRPRYRGRGSILRHCVYGQEQLDMALEYILQFWDTYPENRKLFRTHLSDSHDPHIHYVKYMDAKVNKFLIEFIQRGYMNDTIVFFVSDHGAHNAIQDTVVLPDNAENPENVLPLLLTLVPPSLSPEHRSYLASHEQTFTSHHDLYSTLRTIAEGKITHSPYTESFVFMAEDMPETRDCNNSTVFLAQCWCLNDPEEAQLKMNEIPLFRVWTEYLDV